MDKLGEIGVKIDKVTIASIGAINMHPSIKIRMMKKALIFFSKRLTFATKNTINLLLELLCLGIRSTLISFDGDYYEYHGRRGGERKNRG